MSVIKKQFKTKHSAIEMKNAISTKILPLPALSAFIDKADWQGDTLFIESKFGKGTIKVSDQLVDIYIELTLFGSMAKATIESTLDKEFKQLKD